MKVSHTEIPGVLLIEPTVFDDDRGFFLETFQTQRYATYGITRPFLQDNLSRSRFGILRGLHLQYPQMQGKLVSVMQGRVLVVGVDVRLGSPTFRKHVAIELYDQRQLWIPRGFAHGFIVLSETADFFYRCDALYNPADEIVIRWDDPEIGVDWKVKTPTLAARDASAPGLKQIKQLPKYGEC